MKPINCSYPSALFLQRIFFFPFCFVFFVSVFVFAALLSLQVCGLLKLIKLLLHLLLLFLQFFLFFQEHLLLFARLFSEPFLSCDL